MLLMVHKALLAPAETQCISRHQNMRSTPNSLYNNCLQLTICFWRRNAGLLCGLLGISAVHHALLLCAEDTFIVCRALHSCIIEGLKPDVMLQATYIVSAEATAFIEGLAA